MNYDDCIGKLQILLNITDPEDKPQSIHNFAAAVSLVNWVTRDDQKARDQFACFLSYFEIYALMPESDQAESINYEACQGELIKLPAHLPKD